MRSVGIRQLKQQTSEILRQVREAGAEYHITYHGHVIARLVPSLRPEPAEDDLTSVWTDPDRLADEITRYWPADLSAADAVKEQRREQGNC